MKCPIDQHQLESRIVSNAEVDFCPTCMGCFFEEGELEWAKDRKDMDLRWLDIDLWKDKEKIKLSKKDKQCPHCRLPMYEVSYGGSNIKVDICSICRGIWLDKGEFGQIMSYLKSAGKYGVLYHYSDILKEEAWEMIFKKESLRDEILDFLTVLKLLRYKLMAQYPHIMEAISNLPK